MPQGERARIRTGINEGHLQGVTASTNAAETDGPRARIRTGISEGHLSRLKDSERSSAAGTPKPTKVKFTGLTQTLGQL